MHASGISIYCAHNIPQPTWDTPFENVTNSRLNLLIHESHTLYTDGLLTGTNSNLLPGVQRKAASYVLASVSG